MQWTDEAPRWGPVRRTIPSLHWAAPAAVITPTFLPSLFSGENIRLLDLDPILCTIEGREAI